MCGGGLAHAAEDTNTAKEFESYRHINTAEPQLPRRRFRRENISDDEVREIQDVAATVYPDFIVVISGVVDGCDCEEGSQCTAEVGLALYRENQNHSLLLAKVGEHWRLSVVQAWWLRYHAHQASRPGFKQSYQEHKAWEDEDQKILDTYPACPLKPENWSLIRRDGDRWSTYVDWSSLKVAGDIRRINYKHKNEAPKLSRYFPVDIFSIGVAAFDCKDLRMRDDENTWYLSDGSASRLNVNNSPRWDPVWPVKDRELVCGWNVMQ
jgi:hypothetical protein